MSESFLKPKEKIINTFRKHFSVLITKMIKFLILFAVSMLLFLDISLRFPSFANYINITGLVLLILSLSYAFYIWVVWYYDTYILTNQRIIIIDQKGLFNREVKEIMLEKIEDVTYNISGFLPTIFEVGTIKINSSSAKVNMVDIAKPDLVRELILKLAKKGEDKRTGKDSVERLAEELSKKLK